MSNPNVEFEDSLSGDKSQNFENPNFSILGFETDNLVDNLKQFINMVGLIIAVTICIYILKYFG